MEEIGSGGGGGGRIGGQWKWWALASVTQLGWGILSFKRGYNGSSYGMPIKAFFVGSLFVGSGATASVATLNACGIHKVEDLLELGSNVRTNLGVLPRTKKD